MHKINLCVLLFSGLFFLQVYGLSIDEVSKTIIEFGKTYFGVLESGDDYSIQRPANYADFFQIEVGPGSELVIDLKSNNFDTYLTLYNADGLVIASNDDYNGSTTESQVRIEASEAIYIIEVSSISQASGTYTLRISGNYIPVMDFLFSFNMVNSASSLHHSPALDDEGNIYFSDNRVLYALSKEGDLKWKYESGNYTTAYLSVDNDGTIYWPLQSNKILALNPNGSLKWQKAGVNAAEEHAYIAGVAIADDGTLIYCADSTVASMTKNGELQWAITMDGEAQSKPVIGTDGTVYIGTDMVSGGLVYAISSLGKIKWKADIGDMIRNSLALGPDGTVYALNRYRLYSLNKENGEVNWYYSHGGTTVGSPIVDEMGTAYIVENHSSGNYSFLKALDTYGNLKWSTELPEAETTPAIAEDGTIYVASYEALHAINRENGSILSAFNTENPTQDSPAIKDGIVYFITEKKFHAVDTGSKYSLMESTSANLGNDLSNSSQLYAPSGNFSIDLLDFSQVMIGDVLTGSFIVSNEGNKELTINSMVSNLGLISLDNSSFSLSPGESRTLNYVFSATEEAEVIDTMYFNSNSFPQLILPLTANIVKPTFARIVVDSSSLNFGELYIDSISRRSIVITNAGNVNLTISSITVRDSTTFFVSPDFAIIAPGDSQIVTVTFSPLQEQVYQDILTIANNDSLVTVILEGEGFKLPFFHSSSGNIVFKPHTEFYEVWVKLNYQIINPSVSVFISEDGGETFRERVICNVDGDIFKGLIPAYQEGNTVRYYFEIIDDEGNKYYLPEGAPEWLFSLKVVFSGDANQDGTTNIFDLLTLLSQLGKVNPPTNSSDVNKDGVFNIFDLLALLQSLSAQ